MTRWLLRIFRPRRTRPAPVAVVRIEGATDQLRAALAAGRTVTVYVRGK